jgi:hypothetical protein
LRKVLVFVVAGFVVTAMFALFAVVAYDGFDFIPRINDKAIGADLSGCQDRTKTIDPTLCREAGIPYESGPRGVR